MKKSKEVNSMDICMTKDEAIEHMRKINNKSNDNINGRKNAMSIIIGGVSAGGKLFVSIPLEDIRVDTSYQRPIRDHIKLLTREWNCKKCDPLKVNYRDDGFFYVWDGQHRREAAIAKGIEYLLCDVTIGLTREQEAELFGCQGNGIKKPDPYDIFRANVCAREKVDTSIKEMCDKYDLDVSRSKRPGSLSCLTLARDIFRRGDQELFEWVLELLHIARWNEFAQSHCHRVINSMYEIRRIARDESDYVQRKLINYLQNTTPDKLLINATVKYPQFKDDSKKLKLFLLDVANGDEPDGILGRDRFIA